LANNTTYTVNIKNTDSTSNTKTQAPTQKSAQTLERLNKKLIAILEKAAKAGDKGKGSASSEVAAVLKEYNNKISEITKLLSKLQTTQKPQNVKEIQDLVKVIKVLAKELSELKGLKGTLTRSVSSLGTSQDQKELASLITSLTKSISTTVSKRTDLNIDNNALAKAIAKALAKELARYNKQGSNYKLENPFKDFKGDFSQFIKLITTLIKKLDSTTGADASGLKKVLSDIVLKVANIPEIEVSKDSLNNLRKIVSSLNTVVSTFKNVADKIVKVKVKVDDQEATQKLGKITDQIEAIEGEKKASLKVDVKKNDLIDLLQQLEVVQKVLSEEHKLKIKGDTTISSVIGDPRSLAVAVDQLKYIIDKLDALKATIVKFKSAKGIGEGLVSELEQAYKSLQKLQDKTQAFSFKNTTQPQRVNHIVANKKVSAPLGVVKSTLQKPLPEATPGGAGVGKANRLRKDILNSISIFEKQLSNIDLTTLNKTLEQLSTKQGALLSKAIDDVDQSYKDITTINKEVVKVRKEEVKTTSQLNKARELEARTIQSNIRKQASTSTAGLRSFRRTVPTKAFKEMPIYPGESFIQSTSKAASSIKNPYEKEVYANAKNLAKSLQVLQKRIFDELNKGLKQSSDNSGRWNVVGKTPGQAFKLRGRQWNVDIASSKALESYTGKKGPIDKLLNDYKRKLSKQLFGEGGQKDVVSKEVEKHFDNVAEWLKNNLNTRTYDGKLKEIVNKISKDPAASTKNISDLLQKNFKDHLDELYGATLGEGEIRQLLSKQGVLKTVSLPSAKITSKGTPIVETPSGRQRALSSYSTYKSGFEKAFDTYVSELKSRGSLNSNKAMELAKGTRALDSGKVPANMDAITKALVKALALPGNTRARNLQDIGLEDVKKIYKQATIPMAIEKQRITSGTVAPVKAKTAQKEFEALINRTAASAKSVDAFIDAMDTAGMSAYKVVKSLDEISFSNFYDILNKTLPQKIEAITKHADTSERGFRKFEKAISQMEGLLPIVEYDKPRRGMHQSNIVKSMYQTSSAYQKQFKDDTEFEPMFGPEQQKEFIRNVNKRNRELLYEYQNLDKLDVPEVKTRKKQINLGNARALSSLGLPESTAGAIVDFSKNNTYNFTDEVDFKGINELNTLHGKMISLYKDDLKAMAPFGQQFQQLGRNISNVSSAKIFDPTAYAKASGIKSQFPTLRSNRENEAIMSGRMGTQGYGFNVLAELSHTASTFEDQIVVAGDLAKAVTTVTKKLVRPTSAGGKATAIQEGDISKAGSEIMSIMGVPEKYKGRADVALIKEVKKELSTVRGESTEVQTAKLAEVFMNHFGRKFTTRYGSKGVSITPTKSGSMAEILKKYKEPSIKVMTAAEQKKAGLGVAMLPKSMGELASEIIKQNASQLKGTASIPVEDLVKALKTSGNKFMLELFKNPEKGLVVGGEANVNKKVFEQTQQVFKQLGIELKDGIEGIQQLKTQYSKIFPSKSLVKAKPIDIRISSFGAAKRGLQTEALEMITGNLASTSKTGTTVIKDKIDYKKLLGPTSKKGTLSSYAATLGYAGTGKSEAAIRKAIEKMYGDKAAENKEFIDALVKLESDSSFYVDVIDELGNKHKSLVGPKFVQIIEDAKQFQEWSKGDIASGAKGLKLNLPAYAAYQSIFGPDSNMLKQINAAYDAKQAEAYENILTYLISSNKDYGEQFLKELNTVSLKDIKPFEGSFGTFEKGAANSMLGSVFDTDKFPTAFKTKLPTANRNVKEDFYVPSSIARQPFADPNVAGGYGITGTGRALQNVLTSARSLSAYQNKDLSLLNENDKKTILKYFGGNLQSKLKNTDESSKKTYIEQLFKVAEQNASSEKGLLPESIKKYNAAGLQGVGTASQKEYVAALKEAFVNNKISAKNKLGPLDRTAAELKTLLLGDYQPGKGSSGPSIVSSKKGTNAQFKVLEDIKASMGMDFNEVALFKKDENQILTKKLAQLEKAKQEYFKSLEQELVGKSGAVAQTFFTKKIPAVLAKATNAMVDKTADMKKFGSMLDNINKQYAGVIKDLGQADFTKDVSLVKSLGAEHAKKVASYKKIGLPVLKQNELGIPKKLADKLSVSYTKKFDTKGQVTKSSDVKSTLTSLLTYVEKLEKSLAEGSAQPEVRDYIDKELAPYIESVRFPFTGTSSVQPYKAKLLKTTKGLNEDSLLVPGVPEMDVNKFDALFKSIKARMEQASTKREELRTIGTPETNQKADELTKYIDALSKALSDALPKYIAQAQKLDYDGDQIEIHTATIKEARQEIKRHFDLLTKEVDSTAARFRDVFTYDAMQPTQGAAPLAFMAKAYTKKFPKEHGFDYLQKPFYTENLSYLSNKEKINILASKKVDTDNLTGPDAVNTLMTEMFTKAGASFKSIEGVETLDEAAQKAAEALDKLTEQDKPMAGLVEGYLKESLSNLKFDNAVNAQLFKLHTGTDVESLTKLMRSYEAQIGFGSGEINNARSGNKLDRTNLLRERQTQLNELYRFAVQKGMDVKHAGETPVAGELSSLLTKGPKALEVLIGKIKAGGNYGGLKDFMEENDKALKLNLGRYKTEDLRKAAQEPYMNIQNAEQLNRPELVNAMVKAMGFEGFLRSLQKSIEKQAIAYLSQTKDEKTGEPLGEAGAKKYLTSLYEKGKGINMSKMVTEPFDPLYKYRTGAASGRLKSGLMETFASDIKHPTKDTRGGAYSLMTGSFSKDLQRVNSSIDSKKLEAMGLAIENITFDSAKSVQSLRAFIDELDSLETALRIAPISVNKRTQILQSKSVIGKLTNKPAPPKSGMSEEELISFYKAYDSFIETKALLTERIKRLNTALSVQAKDITSTSTTELPRRNQIQETRAKLAEAKYNRAKGLSGAQSKSGGVLPPTPTEPSVGKYSMGSGIVPVHLVSVNSDVFTKFANTFSMVKAAANTVSAGSDQTTYINKLKDIAARASGGANELKDASFETMYRASAFHGGGKFSFKENYKGPDFEKQVASIKETMLGTAMKDVDKDLLDSTSLIGTALHEMIEDRMVEASNKIKGQGTPIIEKFVSYADDAVGAITGHVDAILTNAEGKMTTAVDIKTVSGKLKDTLGKAVEGAGSADVGAVLGKLGNKKSSSYARYKIEEVRSQLNFYMKALQEAGDDVQQAEVHFYDRMGDPKNEKPVVVRFKFDENLFKKDMKAIKVAREAIQKEIASGKPISFAKTGSLETLSKIAKEESLYKAKGAQVPGRPSKSEIQELLKGGRSYYEAYRNKGAFYKSKGTGSAGISQDQINKFTKPEYQKPQTLNLTPYSGSGPVAELKNIKLLRAAAKTMQASHGVDLEKAAKELPRQAQDMIEGAKTGNVKASDFFKYIKDVQILDKSRENPELDGAKLANAWKLFKDAQLEYLIKKAEQAKQYLENVKKTEDSRQISLAYTDFTKAVGDVQAHVKKGVGKRSDIYTRNKVWSQPDIAKAAGVYMSPSEIESKAAVDIEGDSDLYETYKKIVGDLSGDKRDAMASPMEKARFAIKSLTSMDDELIKLMEDGKLLERLGPEIAEAWDFKGGAQKITRLRDALELFKQYNVSDSPLSVERKNLEQTIKMLKDAENKLTYMDLGRQTTKKGPGAWGETGVVSVPKWLDPKTQEALNKRNIAKIRDYMKTPAAKGGAKVGETYIYKAKVFDQAGNAVKNVQTAFTKYKEVVDATGNTIGKFTTKQIDMNESLAGSHRGIQGAIKRAVMWGAASTIVYGGFNKLKESVGVLADIEVQMASLRMVMNPLTSDFDNLQKSAINMAKQYGVAVTDVLQGMKVFAQQGLPEPQILERTQTATLAANVTTLNAKDATEALTAAMKVFNKEGKTSMHFLDAWSEVESKHAITAGDMADAIKKAASAAKNAGFTFDQLNGIVAAIGSTTRQSGKEVGTSMRFIMRRLTSEKGPKELGKLGISTITGSGELKGGFNILDELAGKWKDLTQAQKMNIAQAIGGTRQYNALLVLMDNWGQALEAIRHSVDSKGSAERKNQELMKTYAKQLEQTKAAMVELQTSVGKVAFPVFKFGLKAVKTIAETLAGIPDSIKAAGAAMLGFLVFLSKGDKIISSIADTLSTGTPVAGGLFGSIKDELKTAAFEILGAGAGTTSVRGLKTVTPGVVSGVAGGKQLSDFNSALGKSTYLIANLGKKFNSYVAATAKGTASATGFVGKTLKKIGNFLSFTSTALSGASSAGVKDKGEDTTWKDIGLRAAGTYGSAKGVKELFKKYGFKSLGKLAGATTAVAGEFVGLGASAAGMFVDAFSKKLGAGGDLFKEWAGKNSGLVESIAPLGLTIMTLLPAFKSLSKEFIASMQSAEAFEKSMYGLKRSQEDQLKTLRNVAHGYSTFKKGYQDIIKSMSPAAQKESKRLGTYRSPLLEMVDKQQEATKMANDLAKVNNSLVAGYDELGNAVLKASGDFENLFSVLEKSKLREMAKTDVSIASKYIKDMTATGGSEKWKYELKALAKEVPAIGGLLSKGINVTPAKALKEAVKELNYMMSQKNKYSLSDIYDKDISKLQEKVTKLSDKLKGSYEGFRKTLSSMSLKGLPTDEISRILSSPELQKGYEMALKIEPKFQVGAMKGKASWQDVLGQEVMKRVYPTKSGLLDVTKELTTANVESAGIAKRQGKVLSGDIVTFMDDAAKKFNMAGRQAIVEYKKTIDGTYDWVATYFNTKTLKVETHKFDSNMQAIVDSVLPVRQIEKDLSDRIGALNEFMAGAGAGLRGISPKDFKRNFNLGERFFSEISTSTILQGAKGYNPLEKSFGKSPFQKGWAADFKKYYAKPMEEYRFLLERLQKMKLDGIDAKSIKMTTGLYDQIVQLQNVLKNNQIIMQYRAAFVDLTKAMEANSRATAENVAVTESRLKLTRETAGLMSGKSKELANLDLGIQDKTKLTAQQRLLIKNPKFEAMAKQLKVLEAKREGTANNIYAIDKTKVALDSIRKVSKGFGTAVKPEDFQKYLTEVAGPGNELKELKVDTTKTAENTANTVDRLDKLIERFDKQGEVRNLSTLLDDLMLTPNDIVSALLPGFVTESGKIVSALDRVAKIRDTAAKTGDSEMLIKSNRALDLLTKRLISREGLAGAAKMIDNKSVGGPGSYSSKEMYSRAFAGMNANTLLGELRNKMPDERKWFGLRSKGGTPEFDKQVATLEALQKENKTKVAESSLLNSKNMAGLAAGTAVFATYKRNYTSKKIEAIDQELKKLSERALKAGEVVSSTITPEGKKYKLSGEYGKRQEELLAQKAQEYKKARFYGSLQGMSAGTGAATLFARKMGLSDKWSMRSGAVGGAIGTYAAAKMQTGLTGEELPESFKKYGQALKDFAKTVSESEGIFGKVKEFFAFRGLKKASSTFMKDFAEESLGIKEVAGATKPKSVREDYIKPGMEKASDKMNEAADKMKEAVDKMATKKDNKAFGGYVQSFAQGGVVKGPGTGTSDSILLQDVPEGSFVIPSKYANKAKALIAKSSYATNNTGSSGKTATIRVSNGELIIPPTMAKAIGRDKLLKLQKGQLDTLAHGGIIGSFAAGGEVKGPTVSVDPIDYNKVAQIATAATASTLARYVAEKDTQKVRAADLKQGADVEAAKLRAIISENSVAAQQVYDELHKQTVNSTKVGGNQSTVKESTILDSEEAYKKAVKDTEKLKKNLETTFDDTTEDVKKLKAELTKLELAEKFKIQLETIERDIKNTNFAKDIQDSLKIGKGIYAGMSVPSTNISLGETSMRGLDKFQLMQLLEGRKEPKTLVEKTSSFFKSPTDTTKALTAYKSLDRLIIDAQSRINAMVSNRSQAVNSGEQKKWDTLIKKESDKLAKLVKSQLAHGGALLKASLLAEQALNRFSSATDMTAELMSQRLDDLNSLQNQGFNGNLRGTPSGLQLIPNNINDLNVEQFMGLAGGAKAKNLMRSYKDRQFLYEAKLAERSSIAKQLALKTQEYNALPSNKGWFSTSESVVQKQVRLELELLSKSAKETDNVLNKLKKELVSISLTLNGFKSLSAAMLQLEQGISQATDSLSGLKYGSFEAKRSLESMYGGSSSFAPQFIDPYAQYKASKAGVQLTLGASNQFDIKRANLMEQLRTSKGTQRSDILTQLNLIPSEKAAYKKSEKLQQISDITRTNFAPIKEFADKLSSFANNPNYNFNEEQRGYFGQQASKLYDMIKQAGENTRNNAVAQKPDMTILEDIKTGLINKAFGGDETKYADYFKNANTPVVNALDSQTLILAKILEVMSGGKEQAKDTLSTLGIDSTKFFPEDELKSFGDKLKTLFQHVLPGSIPFSSKTMPFSPARYFKKLTSEEKALGGTIGTTIKGPGTGTSDSISMRVPEGSFIIQSKYANKAKTSLNNFAKGGVPVNVSNGELLLTPDEVKAIGGVTAARKLNQGKGYASGGGVFNWLSTQAGKGIQSLEDYRLKGTHNILGQAGAATLELGARVGKTLALDPLKTIENISTYQAQKGMKTTLAKGVSMAKGVGSFVSNLNIEQLKEIGASVKTSFMGDIKKGGLGVTSGILSALAGTALSGGVASRLKGFNPLSNEIGAIGTNVKSGGSSIASLMARASGLPADVLPGYTKTVSSVMSKYKDILGDVDLDVSALSAINKKKGNLGRAYKDLRTGRSKVDIAAGNIYNPNVKVLSGHMRSIAQDQDKLLRATMVHEIGHVASRKFLEDAPDLHKYWRNLALKDKYATEYAKESLKNYRSMGADELKLSDEPLAELFRLHDLAGIKEPMYSAQTPNEIKKMFVKILTNKNVQKEFKINRQVPKGVPYVGDATKDFYKFALGGSIKNKKHVYTNLFGPGIQKLNSKGAWEEMVLPELQTISEYFKSQGIDANKIDNYYRNKKKYRGEDVTRATNRTMFAPAPSFMDLNSQRKRITKAGFKTISDATLLKMVGNTGLRGGVKVNNASPMIKDNYLGYYTNSYDMHVANRANVFDQQKKEMKARRILRSRQLSAARPDYEALRKDDLNKYKMSGGIDIFGKASADVEAMPSRAKNTKYDVTTKSGKLFKDIDSLLRFGGDEAKLTKFIEANKGNMNIAVFGDTDVANIKNWADVKNPKTKALMMKSLVEGTKTLQGMMSQYKNTSDVVEKSNLFANMRYLFEDKLAGTVFKNVAEKRDTFDLSGGRNRRYFPVSVSYLKHIGIDSAGINQRIKDGSIYKDTKTGKLYVDRKEFSSFIGSSYFKTPGISSKSSVIKAGTEENAFMNIITKDYSPEAFLKKHLLGGFVKGHKHTGGMINSTGNYFLEKGELVVSKNFKNGGLALSDELDSKSLNIPTTSITIDNIGELNKAIEELKSVEFKVDVSDTKVPVDVSDATVKVDVGDAKVPVDVNDAKVSVDVGEAKIGVDVTGVKVPVDLPEATIKVDTSSFEAAVNKLTSLNLEGVGAAVGAEKNDQLATVLDNLSNQITDLKVRHTEDITMLNTKIEDTSSIAVLSDIQEKHTLDTAYLEKQINDLISDLNVLRSDKSGLSQEMNTRFMEQEAKLNRILTHVYSVSALGGLYNG